MRRLSCRIVPIFLLGTPSRVGPVSQLVGETSIAPSAGWSRAATQVAFGSTSRTAARKAVSPTRKPKAAKPVKQRAATRSSSEPRGASVNAVLAAVCEGGAAVTTPPPVLDDVAPGTTAAASPLPDGPALHDGTGTYSYSALRTASATVGRRLQDIFAKSAPSGGDAGKRLRGDDPGASTAPRHVLVLFEPGFHFACGVLASWMAGGVAVPMCHTHSHLEWEHVAHDSKASVCLTTRKLAPDMVKTVPPTTVIVAIEDLLVPQAGATPTEEDTTQQLPSNLSHIRSDDDALIVYTSGTTAKPKGVVHTHSSLSNQIRVLLAAWRWTNNDRVLNVLPLHHVHGLVNVLFCALAARVQHAFMKFDAKAVTDRLQQGDLTLFMAVPTVYAKICDELEKRPTAEQDAWKAVVSRRLRLMVSGSSALPVPILERFRQLSGHTLLERYGMTETGMILSQPVLPAVGRTPGSVGLPLPTVEVLIASTPNDGQSWFVAKPNHRYISGAPGKKVQVASGELMVRSDSLFHRYFGRPDATDETFVTIEGKRWFRTGDTAEMCVTIDESKRDIVPTPPPSTDAKRVPRSQAASSSSDEHSVGDAWYAAECWRTARAWNLLLDCRFVPSIGLLGRTSVDILKVAGYKVSALEVESAFLDADAVAEIAVFGMPVPNRASDVIVAMCVVKGSLKDLSADDVQAKLREIAGARLAPYKRPGRYCVVPDAIPKNAMNKVNKKALMKALMEADSRHEASASAANLASSLSARDPNSTLMPASAATATAGVDPSSSAAAGEEDSDPLYSNIRVLRWPKGTSVTLPSVGQSGGFPVTVGPWNGPIRGGQLPLN